MSKHIYHLHGISPLCHAFDEQFGECVSELL